MSATWERVTDEGKQQVFGAVDGQTRDLNLRVATVRRASRVYATFAKLDIA